MHQAAWGDEAGSTVTFKLPMNKEAEDQRNPFHSFTKRRKGKAGTRFMMVCHRQIGADKLRETVYEDEVMLAGWNDSQLHGHTVKFWICNDLMGHPFEGIDRHEIILLGLVELDDDNESIDQKMREKVEKQKATGKQKLSNVAALLCRTPEFSKWCDHMAMQDPMLAPLARTPNVEDRCKEFIYQLCGIRSRAELDRNGQAAQLFHDTVRKPYEVWYVENIEVC
jgi:hypothetical protein